MNGTAAEDAADDGAFDLFICCGLGGRESKYGSARWRGEEPTSRARRELVLGGDELGVGFIGVRRQLCMGVGLHTTSLIFGRHVDRLLIPKRAIPRPI